MGIPFVMLNATGRYRLTGGGKSWVLGTRGMRNMSIYGYNVIDGNEAIVGDTVRITATGSVATPEAASVDFEVFLGPVANPGAALGFITLDLDPGTVSLFIEFLLTFQPNPQGANAIGVAANGTVVSSDDVADKTNLPGWAQRDLTQDNRVDLFVDASGQNANLVLLLDQLVIEFLTAGYTRGPYQVMAQQLLWPLIEGFLNGLGVGAVAPGPANTGKTAATALYLGGTFYGADAYQDTGKTNNTVSVAFTYGGSEASGGVAAGLRWNFAGQQGIFAYIDSSGPYIKIFEMSSGWAYVQEAQATLTLTTGNRYTLTVSDNGAGAAASITDDSGQQSCQIITTSNTSNTQVMFGWLGLTASYLFDAVITAVNVAQSGTVENPALSLAAGSYQYAQSLAIRTTTVGAAIYYTTDGSTPTTSSTLYTSPTTVSASAYIQAIAALPGWTNSAVSGAQYAIASWTMEFGTIDGAASGALALTGADTGKTSASAVYAGTWYAATAYQNLGTSQNSISATFTHQGAEGGGGVAVGPFPKRGDAGLE
jgi:hypothetical protein